MATSAPSSSAQDCPVCHDGFQEPKLLPCAHCVCRKCVLSWLEEKEEGKGEGGDNKGCPLCRAPILKEEGDDQTLDLASRVDALPTDLALAMAVESEKTLQSSNIKRQCSWCEEEGEARVFCLQCAIMLCSACIKIHKKIPSCQGHVTQPLGDLSADLLASHYQMLCTVHSPKPLELFCTGHQELMCVRCVSSTHRQCSEARDVEDVAPEKREELASLIQRLQNKEETVTAKISQLDREMLEAQVKFKAMRGEVKVAFDDLQATLEAKRQKLTNDIQAREETYMADRKATILLLEDLQASIAAHKNTAQQLAASTSDVVLLGMMKELRARLNSLLSQDLPQDPRSTQGSLQLEASTVGMAQKALAAVGALGDLGQVDTSGYDRCLVCERELEGPGYAAMIRVGDRVRRGKGWIDGSTWEDQHEGLTCGQFEQWKIDNDPNNQAMGLARHLEENGIDCPSCKMRYARAKGGCVHFKCPQCGHEFCSGCYQPFYQRGMCASAHCKLGGLHAHHPRDCFFYLREEDVKWLQGLLKESGVVFNTDPPDGQGDVATCPVIEQKEFDSGCSDESCGKETQPGLAGLCVVHYKEYLVGLINKNHLDPVLVMSVDEQKKLLNRWGHACPKPSNNESEANYRKRLAKFIKDKVPLPSRGP